MASAAARRLHLGGFEVVMTELPQPLCIRRLVSFAEAIYEGEMWVEGVQALRADDPPHAESILAARKIPVLIDPDGGRIPSLKPVVIVDARMRKRSDGTRIADAPVVIGLGPGFSAGVDCHAVVETNRGHALGRVLYRGTAEADTGVPAAVAGFTAARVLRSPADGLFRANVRLGQIVRKGEIIGEISGQTVAAQIAGIIRGLIRDGLFVGLNAKLGDIDPRGEPSYCTTISDKANAIAGGVLEACLHLTRERRVY